MSYDILRSCYLFLKMIHIFLQLHPSSKSRFRASSLIRCKYTRNNKIENEKVLTYSRKNPVEHVLLRPGMYIGSVEPSTTQVWKFDQKENRMERESLLLSPALLKVFRKH